MVAIAVILAWVGNAAPSPTLADKVAGGGLRAERPAPRVEAPTEPMNPPAEPEPMIVTPLVIAALTAITVVWWAGRGSRTRWPP